MFSSQLPPPKNPGSNVPKIKLKHEQSHLGVLVPHALDEKNPSMVANENSPGKAIVSNVYANKDGSLNYNLTIAAAADPDRTFQASYDDTIPLKKRFPHLKHSFPLPSPEDEEFIHCINETASIINEMLSAKLGISKDKNHYNSTAGLQNIDKNTVTLSYNSNSIVDGRDEEVENRGRSRTIQISNFQEDPLLPPKFKIRKNKAKEPSPPPPILKKAPSKPLSQEEQDAWKIPAAISNWKNNQGFTISLDKRMLAANEGAKSNDQLNIEKFGDLSSALESADKQAREEIALRNKILSERAKKEQLEKEQKLLELAELSRKERIKRPNETQEHSAKRRK